MADETQVEVTAGDAKVTITTPAPAVVDVAEHDQKTTIHLIEHIQAHEPRESDPHYHLFHEAVARIRALGLYHCALKPCRYELGGAQLETHHSQVEFSEQGGVDLAKFNEAYGLHLADDEAFKAYIEGEGNLEILCSVHHRTRLGIHELPGPFWSVLRVWKADLLPPAEVVAGR